METPATLPFKSPVPKFSSAQSCVSWFLPRVPYAVCVGSQGKKCMRVELHVEFTTVGVELDMGHNYEGRV